MLNIGHYQYYLPINDITTLECGRILEISDEFNFRITDPVKVTMDNLNLRYNLPKYVDIVFKQMRRNNFNCIKFIIKDKLIIFDIGYTIKSLCFSRYEEAGLIRKMFLISVSIYLTKGIGSDVILNNLLR